MFLMNYDNKCLVEFKTGLRVELPDYVTYSSVVVGSSHRGGTVVCIRNSLADQIRSVDVCTGDQVWLRGVLVYFCYVLPSDSPYYSHSSFAAINENLLSFHSCSGVLLMDDMNCRFGGLVRHLRLVFDPPT